MHSRSQSPSIGFWLFLFLAAVYLLSYSGTFHAIDEVSVAAMTESLVKHGQVSTDQIWWSQGWGPPSQGRIGPDGHLYSKKGVGMALLGAPFYWLALRLPAMGAIQGLMLANALVTALTGWLVYSCVLRLGYRPAVAAFTALGYGLGTMTWPYAKYFFSEPLATLGLVASLWGLLTMGQTGRMRYAALAGAGLGLALLAKVANGVIWPLFVAYCLWIAFRQRKIAAGSKGRRPATLAVAFLLPLATAALALATYNAVRTGHPLDIGYTADETFSTPLGQGVAGLLLSPGKSLFLYSPLLLAALFGIPALLRRDQATTFLGLGIAALYLLFYARWFTWWGGWSWGPRFLVPVLPFLSLFLAPVVERALRPSPLWIQGSLVTLGLLSLWVQLLGVTVDFNRYLMILSERSIDSAQVYFQVGLSPLLGHWSLLRVGVWDLAWARNLPAEVDWPRLLWPLGLLAVAVAGWRAVQRVGRARRWLFAAAGLALLSVSAVTVTRLPAPTDDWQVGCQVLSAVLHEAAQPGDILIVDLWPYSNHLALSAALMERYKAGPVYWGWTRQEPVSAEQQRLLAGLSREHRRLWLVLDTTPEAHPSSTTERWLDEHTFRVEGQWLSLAMRLVLYQLPTGSLDEAPSARLDIRLGDRLRLMGYSPAGPFELHAGDVLAFSLFWQAEQPVEQDYVVFAQLLDQEGGLRAQLDRSPVGGFRPTHTWQPTQLIRDNYGLALPPDLPPGRYQFIVGLYLPSNMDRLIVSTADGVQVGDYVPLTEVMVSRGERP